MWCVSSRAFLSRSELTVLRSRFGAPAMDMSYDFMSGVNINGCLLWSGDREIIQCVPKVTSNDVQGRHIVGSAPSFYPPSC